MDTTGKLNPEIEKILEAHCIKNGWGTTERDFAEVLTEGREVYSEIGSSHRWYDEKFIVIKIDDNYIGYNYYHVTGDNGISDMGLDFDLSSVCFCEEYQVFITKYRAIEKAKA